MLALRVPFKRAIIYSLIALLPELDVLFHIHRWFSHTVIVWFIALTPLLLLSFYGKVSFKTWTITLLVIISHLILDLTNSYTPILWPLLNLSILITFSSNVIIGEDVGITYDFNFKVEPTVFNEFQHLDAPLYTTEGLLITIILLLPIVLGRILQRYRILT